MTLVSGWSTSGAGAQPAVRVLGPLQLSAADGTAIPIAARKHADLLVILAAERSTRSAGYLCELLWRGAPPDSAQVTLQGYVSRLRRALGPSHGVAIETTAQGYVLRCEAGGTDLDLLDTLARDARGALADGDTRRAVDLLETALGLWRGEALEDVADVAELAPERARLDELRSELTEACAEGMLALGQATRAITVLAPAHGRHPLREGTARLLALALRAAGRAPEALDVLVDLRRGLRDELGLDPDPDTVRVEREIRSSPAPAPDRTGAAKPAAPPGPALGAGPPGRATDAAALERAWRESAGRLAVVTVSGAAGIGKSTLVHHALGRHRGAALLTSGVAGGGTAPFETLGPWLEQAALAGYAPPSAPSVAGVAAMLAAMVRESGHLVAVVEDVQWADRDSLRLLGAALRVLRAHPILLLLTRRPGTLDADRAAALGLLRAVGTHTDLTLQPLTPDAVRALVGARLGAGDRATVEEIVTRSLGNPLLAAQLCDLADAGEPITEDAVAGVVAWKLESVSEPARRLAEALAVIGQRTTAHLAAAVAELDGIDDVDARLTELALAQVVEVDGTELDFAHELLRRAVLDGVGALRRCALHGRVADAVESVSPRALAAIASHRSAAAPGSVSPAAARACERAAADALARGATSEAARLATLGATHADPDDPRLAVALDSLAGQAHTRLGDYETAGACFDRAGRLLAESGDHAGLARLALLAAPSGVGGFFSGYGVVQTGNSDLRGRALAHRLDLEADLVARLQAAEAADRAAQGLAGDLDHLREAQALTETGSAAWAQVRLAEFICRWEPTTVADRAKIADELADLAGADPQARATALHLRRVCALEAGDLRLVRRLSAEFTRVAADGGPDLQAMQLWWQVMLAVLRGDYAESNALMTRHLEGLGAVSLPARRLAEVSMATSQSIELWHRGRLAEFLDQAGQLAGDFDEDFAIVVAMASAEAGQHERAIGLVESVVEQPGRLHGPRVAVRVPLLTEALLAIGRGAPALREEVRALAATLEPATAGWGDALVVQWPGLVCLGPSGLYRGTLRGVLGLPDAHATVVAAGRRARALGAAPYAARAEERLRGWPFVDGSA
ncbi:BTAD domain-containing putative transcriptional regulator [Nocardioides sp. GY 10113]|uniref:BTAD domain-containing putative transcriptional regulator n=1 Tax=Nocardioides sp. GY 10113 TaxID=2569761 RepID=UPI0014585444|nr:BTAD domain-containing putative transcriptional regulator [Nocardioides sp. GY 10113]